MKRSGFLGLVLSLFVFSCTEKEDENKRVFIAGQIINPSSRTVTFYEGNKIVDMFELDEQLRFQKYYDSLSNGIFKLEHLPEYQSLLLEQGDSLWVRINAATFDESVVYSGKGASKNNFLMELFLKQEKENQFLS